MVAAGGLACLTATVMLSACAADVPEETTSAQSELACHDKITICHHTGSDANPTLTISISPHAWPAHEKHGDTMGACPPPQPRCGNGVAEGSEECDGTDLKGSTCETALGSGATWRLDICTQWGRSVPSPHRSVARHEVNRRRGRVRTSR